jgi:hypothetical protein
MAQSKKDAEACTRAPAVVSSSGVFPVRPRAWIEPYERVYIVVLRRGSVELVDEGLHAPWEFLALECAQDRGIRLPTMQNVDMRDGEEGVSMDACANIEALTGVAATSVGGIVSVVEDRKPVPCVRVALAQTAILQDVVLPPGFSALRWMRWLPKKDDVARCGRSVLGAVAMFAPVV